MVSLSWQMDRLSREKGMKSFKQYVVEADDYPYHMTYAKTHSDSKGKINHVEFRHVTHKLEGKPTTPEGARGMVSRTNKHQELKSQGYKPHSVGHHEDDQPTSYGRPVKHVHDHE